MFKEQFWHKTSIDYRFKHEGIIGNNVKRNSRNEGLAKIKESTVLKQLNFTYIELPLFHFMYNSIWIAIYVQSSIMVTLVVVCDH